MENLTKVTAHAFAYMNKKSNHFISKEEFLTWASSALGQIPEVTIPNIVSFLNSQNDYFNSSSASTSVTSKPPQNSLPSPVVTGNLPEAKPPLISPISSAKVEAAIGGSNRALLTNQRRMSVAAAMFAENSFQVLIDRITLSFYEEAKEPSFILELGDQEKQWNFTGKSGIRFETAIDNLSHLSATRWEFVVTYPQLRNDLLKVIIVEYYEDKCAGTNRILPPLSEEFGPLSSREGVKREVVVSLTNDIVEIGLANIELTIKIYEDVPVTPLPVAVPTKDVEEKVPEPKKENVNANKAAASTGTSVGYPGDGKKEKSEEDVPAVAIIKQNSEDDGEYENDSFIGNDAFDPVDHLPKGSKEDDESQYENEFEAEI